MKIEIVLLIKYVDQVVIQDDLDKFKAWEKYKYNILFSGDDWKGNPRWLEYKEKLKKVNVMVKYFNYTKTISSSKLQTIISNKI